MEEEIYSFSVFEHKVYKRIRLSKKEIDLGENTSYCDFIGLVMLSSIPSGDVLITKDVYSSVIWKKAFINMIQLSIFNLYSKDYIEIINFEDKHILFHDFFNIKRNGFYLKDISNKKPDDIFDKIILDAVKIAHKRENCWGESLKLLKFYIVGL